MLRLVFVCSLLAGCLWQPAAAVAQAAHLSPSTDPCSVLERKRERGVLEFTVQEAWVAGYVESWLSDNHVSILPDDIWTVFGWIDDECRADSDFTLRGATSKVIYEKIFWPNRDKILNQP